MMLPIVRSCVGCCVGFRDGPGFEPPSIPPAKLCSADSERGEIGAKSWYELPPSCMRSGGLALVWLELEMVVGGGGGAEEGGGGGGIPLVALEARGLLGLAGHYAEMLVVGMDGMEQARA